MQYRLILSTVFIFLLSLNSYATLSTTKRIAQFNNNKVSVWETIIYPSATQILKMHRHDNDRVLVAFNDGLLKVTSDKGKVHYMMLKKNKAYYLTKDTLNELHKDQNMTSHPIKVMVVELKD